MVIILHHGKSKFKGVTELSEMFHPLEGIEGHYPKLQAILVDLNAIEDDDRPRSAGFKVVMMVLKTVFRKDVSKKMVEVLRELEAISNDPVTMRLIRTIWVYLVNNARYMKRNFAAMLTTFEKITGEKAMSTMAEIWKAEGLEEGEARGEHKKALNNLLQVLFKRYKNDLTESLTDNIRAITDVGRLDELFDLALDCDSLDEFADALK